MKKTLVAAVLACAMSVFGFAASLQAQEAGETSANGPVKSGQYSTQLLKLVNTNATSESLTASLVKVPSVEGKTFGYLQDNKFVSLGDAVGSVELPYNQVIKFGYGIADAENSEFEPRTVSLNVSVSSDPGYYGGYNPEGFYQLDFSEDPFDGMIEIIIGEPLPAPAVTLLVALAAGALFLLYKNRRQRSLQSEQA